ncbi:hypothetical protein [Roseibacillus persicicus]|uniref:beta-propeller domain-containing protein n=1 Tax=Roseibacillus persicicus TaxID=454148 RepID=UPI00280EC917|nr:hypothetical protein [Roseibacillus persicicus]MDQ8189107.1 hypothetical protein [Roseibacillus persicicus]
MLKLPFLLTLFSLSVLSAEEPFGRQVSETGVRHSFLLAGATTALISEEGEVLWKTPGKARDGFVLENNNVLVTIGNVAKEFAEGTQDVVWSYQLHKENQELGSAVRLANGNILVVERGKNPRLLEIDPKGEPVVEVPLQPETERIHMQTRMARKLPNGNYLVPHLLAFAVKEYTAEGKVVRTIRTDLEEWGGGEAKTWPFTAIHLENGNTLVNLTNGNRTAEFDSEGKLVWSLSNKEVGGRFADPCGGQRLPNGNTVICSYGQKNGEMPRVFEVDRAGKVVWEFFHPSVGGAHEIHVLTTNGEALGKPLK